MSQEQAPVPGTDVIAEYFLDDVSAFEAVVLEQRQTPQEHYDETYFAGDWRDGENRYDLETRRHLEGRNPQFIKDVFTPERVLDVGCGPGFLMFLLHELGVDVHGVDYAQASLTLAPEEIRDRITIGDTSDAHADGGSFDLVICREVFEHLTVLQVRESVRQMCQASTKYVYVTTRFHPDPANLLDFTTQFETDPSHITLLSKDFLRVLFVLEGFRRRADLEERMDWGGKNRVLVYERAAVPE